MVRQRSLITRALPSLTLLLLFVGSSIPTATAIYTPATIQAGGSTFVNPLMQVWANGFSSTTGGVVHINYASLGSTAGQKGVLKKTYSFGGSDAPISSSLYTPNYTTAYGPLLTIPESLGGVAIFYNIPGASTSHPLNVTGAIIADIYLRDITMWNDPVILAINSYYTSSDLNTAIVPVHRSDGSGTTYALTTFLVRTSTDWNSSGLGRGTIIAWPASGELGASGSSGVAAGVSGNTGGIGYADSYYAISNHLTAAFVLNQDGKYLQPTLSNIAAAANADAAKVQANPTYSITNAPGSSSYPISTYTYLLVWEDQTDQGVGNDLAQFFWWAVTTGQSDGPPLNYLALPANIVSIDEAIIAQLNYQGTPFITITTATITCKFSSVIVGHHDKCTASVAGGSKGGAVAWASDQPGRFTKSACILSAHLMCSVYYIAGAATSTDVLASYLGNGGAGGFNGQTAIQVNQTISKTKLTCTPSGFPLFSSTTCKATVHGYLPSGTVTFSQSGGTGAVSGGSCNLAQVGHSTQTARCSITITSSARGSVTLLASYAGDTNNMASSKTHPLTVG
jgi:phosphate transport system substrate-binding protein